MTPEEQKSLDAVLEAGNKWSKEHEAEIKSLHAKALKLQDAMQEKNSADALEFGIHTAAVGIPSAVAHYYTGGTGGVPITMAAEGIYQKLRHPEKDDIDVVKDAITAGAIDVATLGAGKLATNLLTKMPKQIPLEAGKSLTKALADTEKQSYGNINFLRAKELAGETPPVHTIVESLKQTVNDVRLGMIPKGVRSEEKDLLNRISDLYSKEKSAGFISLEDMAKDKLVLDNSVKQQLVEKIDDIKEAYMSSMRSIRGAGGVHTAEFKALEDRVKNLDAVKKTIEANIDVKVPYLGVFPSNSFLKASQNRALFPTQAFQATGANIMSRLLLNPSVLAQGIQGTAGVAGNLRDKLRGN